MALPLGLLDDAAVLASKLGKPLFNTLFKSQGVKKGFEGANAGADYIKNMALKHYGAGIPAEDLANMTQADIEKTLAEQKLHNVIPGSYISNFKNAPLKSVGKLGLNSLFWGPSAARVLTSFGGGAINKAMNLPHTLMGQYEALMNPLSASQLQQLQNATDPVLQAKSSAAANILALQNANKVLNNSYQGIKGNTINLGASDLANMQQAAGQISGMGTPTGAAVKGAIMQPVQGIADQMNAGNVAGNASGIAGRTPVAGNASDIPSYMLSQAGTQADYANQMANLANQNVGQYGSQASQYGSDLAAQVNANVNNYIAMQQAQNAKDLAMGAAGINMTLNDKLAALAGTPRPVLTNYNTYNQRAGAYAMPGVSQGNLLNTIIAQMGGVTPSTLNLGANNNPLANYGG